MHLFPVTLRFHSDQIRHFNENFGPHILNNLNNNERSRVCRCGCVLPPPSRSRGLKFITGLIKLLYLFSIKDIDKDNRRCLFD